MCCCFVQYDVMIRTQKTAHAHLEQPPLIGEQEQQLYTDFGNALRQHRQSGSSKSLSTNSMPVSKFFQQSGVRPSRISIVDVVRKAES